MSFSLLIFWMAGSISCSQRSVARIDPSQAVELSGRWNDTDSRLIAEKMSADLLGSDSFREYSKTLGKEPAIIVGLIKNKSTEHIDTDVFIKKIELAIYNSGTADLVESGEFRDKLRVERVEQQDFADPATMSQWGKELGANLMLFGNLSSETDVYNNKRVVNYTTTLFLTDMETNKRVWYGQQEIKKFIRN